MHTWHIQTVHGEAESLTVGKTPAELDIRGRVDITNCGFRRGNTTVIQPDEMNILKAGDTGILSGTDHGADRLRSLLSGGTVP